MRSTQTDHYVHYCKGNFFGHLPKALPISSLEHSIFYKIEYLGGIVTVNCVQSFEISMCNCIVRYSQREMIYNSHDCVPGNDMGARCFCELSVNCQLRNEQWELREDLKRAHKRTSIEKLIFNYSLYLKIRGDF